MNIEIITKPFNLHVSGFSGIAQNKDYSGTAFKLMDRMWPIVKSNNLEHKGQNIWIYEENEQVFAGVELNTTPPSHTGLEQKVITLEKYAYYKHIGPYNLIKHAGQAMMNEISAKGFQTANPYIEIYGHWTPDETKLETELFISLR